LETVLNAGKDSTRLDTTDVCGCLKKLFFPF